MKGQAGSGRPQPAQHRLGGLEWLRFFAASAVLVWHYQHFAWAGGIGFEVEAQPFYALLAPFYLWGERAVEVFWCLSGYIFFQSYHERIASRQVDFTTFAVYRFSRLYPLHILTLIAVALMQGIYHRQFGEYFVNIYQNAYHFMLHLMFAAQWGLQHGLAFNAPIWSVSLEIPVYALFFVLARQTAGARTVIAILACLVLSVLLGWDLLARCALYFFAGGSVRVLCRDLATRHALRIAAFMAIALLVAFSVVREFTAITPPRLVFDLPWTMLLVGVAALPLSFFTRSEGLAASLGNLTYAIYLLHFPMQLAIVLIMTRFGLPIDYRSPLLFTVYFSTVLALAFAVFHMIERPAQQSIRKLYMNRRRKREAPAIQT